MSRRRVAYYYDNDLGSFTYGLGHPMKPHRMRVTHELLSAYGMLNQMHVLRPARATPEAMTCFHTDEYIHFLNRVTPETAEELTFGGQRFLVGEDNPAFEGVFEFCSISAGGSICAAQRLASGAADIAVNWAGGLHHAKKREASGFCYINDIVLGILELLRTYARVLYIDIDCHHGDGVEEAFYTTDRVMTCSFHKFGEYFPGTGTQEDKGRGRGRGYSLNVPLKDGITDGSFKSVFVPIIDRILEVYRPSAVVLQCGADSLAGDKLGCFNLTMHGHAYCVQHLRKANIPLILLGGGGYTVKNVARTWTYETACALGIEDTIDPNLPWNEYFEWFGPKYRLEVAENNMDDLNTKEGTLDQVRAIALQQLSELQPVPSVGMHDVPRETLGRHLKMKFDEEEGRDELDEQLAQHARFVYNLQGSDSTDISDLESSRDESEGDSTAGSRSRSRRRRRQQRHAKTSTRKQMSILTNHYFDVPALEQANGHLEHGAPGKGSRRRFFMSAARWDTGLERVLVGRQGLPRAGEERNALSMTAAPNGGALKKTEDVDEGEEGDQDYEDEGDDDESMVDVDEEDWNLG